MENHMLIYLFLFKSKLFDFNHEYKLNIEQIFFFYNNETFSIPYARQLWGIVSLTHGCP